MDAADEVGVHRIVVMGGSQFGKTEIILNILGKFSHLDPSPILLIQPTIEMAESFSKERIAPMIRDTPALSAVYANPKSRKSENAIRHKSFRGGFLALAGANSAAGLAGRPIRIVLGDEIDRWPESAGSEGDPLDLASKRTTNFWNSLQIYTSTPTTSGISRIEKEYEASDRRIFLIPCPHCGTMQQLVWRQVKWPEDEPLSAHYECETCEATIANDELKVQLRFGEWRARSKFRGVAGFHISQLYSPWRTLGEVAAEFLDAKHKGRESLKVWTNTALGETWEEADESADPNTLYARREQYPVDEKTGEMLLPEGALMLVCAVDTQDSYLQAEVIAYGKDSETWGISSRVLLGNTSQKDVWDQLDGLLEARWRRVDGVVLGIGLCGIDSGGHRTQIVYDYVMRRQSRGVHALKGQAGEGLPAARRSKRRSGKGQRKIDLFIVGVDGLKSTIYARMALISPGPGFMHYPISDDYDEEYFAQLTAEKRTVRYRKGFARREWVNARAGNRNEALDIRVYAEAVVAFRRPNWAKLARDLKPREEILREPTIKELRRGKARSRNRAQTWKDGF